MSSLVLNLIIGFWLILFGAMALFPLMLSDKQPQRSSASNNEDRVISIRPAIVEGTGHRARDLPQPTSIAADRSDRDDDQHQPLHAA